MSHLEYTRTRASVLSQFRVEISVRLDFPKTLAERLKSGGREVLGWQKAGLSRDLTRSPAQRLGVIPSP